MIRGVSSGATGVGRRGLSLRWQWVLTIWIAAVLAVAAGSFAHFSAGGGAGGFVRLFVPAGVAAMLVSAFAFWRAGKIEARLEFTAGLLERASQEIIDEAGKSEGKARAPDERSGLGRLDAAAQSASRGLHSLAVERRQARELVDREGQAKVQFFAAMSHELRTPLNAILGYSTLLLEDAVARGDTAASADIDRIGLAGRRLLDLIDNLLELSGMKSDRGGVRRTLVGLPEIIEEAKASLDTAKDGASRVKDEGIGAGTLLVTDRKRCARALRNMLDAALAHAEGDISLREWSDPVAGTFNLSIGCPDWNLEDKDLAILFDGPGAQDVPTKSDRQLVALAVSRSHARSLGGDCFARARRPGGVELVLAIPMDGGSEASVSDAHEQDLEAALEHQLKRCKDAAGRKVLVIDDDLAAIDLLGRWLHRLDCFVLEASSGAEGLMLAREARPDLILLDALMPERTGYDVLEEIKSDPNISDIPVVLITVDDDRARGLEAGASDYIRKPISEAQLCAVVQSYNDPASGKILVVDDDDDAAEIMCRNLDRLGFRSVRAVDGQQGLELAKRSRPGAIVLDIRMPQIDGFAFIEKLAKEEGLSNVPVIVVSGHDLSLVQHRKLSEAGYRFFTKGQAAPREIADTLKELVA